MPGRNTATAAGAALAVFSGIVWSVQAKMNVQLGVDLHDPIASAAANFVGGAAVLVVAAAISPARAVSGLTALNGALRTRSLSPLTLLAGIVGACIVLAQVYVVEVVGLAAFTVTLVAGSAIMSILIDHTGYGPRGQVAVTPMRLLGAAVLVAAVALVGFTGGASLAFVPAHLWGFGIAFLAGALIALQQAMNGALVMASRSVLVPSLVGFGSGAVVLVLIRAFGGAVRWPDPVPWLLLMAGPLAVVFIGLSALLATRIGLLLLSAAVVVGQTAGSLVIDFALPGAAGAPEWPSLVGVLLTVAAVAVIALGARRSVTAAPRSP